MNRVVSMADAGCLTIGTSVDSQVSTFTPQQPQQPPQTVPVHPLSSDCTQHELCEDFSAAVIRVRVIGRGRNEVQQNQRTDNKCT